MISIHKLFAYLNKYANNFSLKNVLYASADFKYKFEMTITERGCGCIGVGVGYDSIDFECEVSSWFVESVGDISSVSYRE